MLSNNCINPFSSPIKYIPPASGGGGGGTPAIPDDTRQLYLTSPYPLANYYTYFFGGSVDRMVKIGPTTYATTRVWDSQSTGNQQPDGLDISYEEIDILNPSSYRFGRVTIDLTVGPVGPNVTIPPPGGTVNNALYMDKYDVVVHPMAGGGGVGLIAVGAYGTASEGAILHAFNLVPDAFPQTGEVLQYQRSIPIAGGVYGDWKTFNWGENTGYIGGVFERVTEGVTTSWEIRNGTVDAGTTRIYQKIRTDFKSYATVIAAEERSTTSPLIDTVDVDSRAYFGVSAAGIPEYIRGVLSPPYLGTVEARAVVVSWMGGAVVYTPGVWIDGNKYFQLCKAVSLNTRYYGRPDTPTITIESEGLVINGLDITFTDAANPVRYELDLAGIKRYRYTGTSSIGALLDRGSILGNGRSILFDI